MAMLRVSFAVLIIFVAVFSFGCMATRDRSIVYRDNYHRGTPQSRLEGDAEYVINPSSVPSIINECDFGYGARGRVTRTERDNSGYVTKNYSADCKKTKWIRGK